MIISTRLDAVRAAFETSLLHSLPVIHDPGNQVLECWTWLGDVSRRGQRLLRHTTQYGSFDHEQLGKIYWHVTIVPSVILFRKHTDRLVKRG